MSVLLRPQEGLIENPNPFVRISSSLSVSLCNERLLLMTVSLMESGRAEFFKSFVVSCEILQ